MKKEFPRLMGRCVCVGVFRKTGDIHNMAETIFLRYFFHFYMLCLIASLTVDYCCLICVLFVCVLAYSIKICILFSLYSEWVHFSKFSYLQNCTGKKNI